MKTCDRCGVKFNNVLEALDHNTNFRHTYKQMDPVKKAAIVGRVESELFPFLLGHGMPQHDKPVKIVIERFADPFNTGGLLAGLPEPNWVG